MPKINSGLYWVNWANTHARNSLSIDDLEMPFKLQVQTFIKALVDAGARIVVESTKRDPMRAYLFHWCWKVSQGQVKANAVPAMPGVDIEWNHGTDSDSIKAADDMVLGFDLVVPPDSHVAPSLTSNHIIGKAIDMTITWTGTIILVNKQGSEVEVDYMKNVNLNTKLHEVGESYGVKKLITDAPHWSFNGL